jgi:hypothetical protein
MDPGFASAIVWFDAYVTNVDRTPRNVNLLLWQGAVWLIDHGAALFFHHSWERYLERSQTPFPQIKEHVLLLRAGALPEADIVLRERLTPNRIDQIVAAIPAEWLWEPSPFASVVEHRAAYAAYLTRRLEASALFVEEAMRARSPRL